MTTGQKNESEIKLLKLKKYLPLFIACPYTRAIFLGGSISLGTARKESDIDIFVVSKNNRVWINKFFMTLTLSLAGERRTKKILTDKFCLNVFLSNKNPVLPHCDSVGAIFYKNLLPAWSADEDEIKNFWEANSWIKKYSDVSPISQKKMFESNPAHKKFMCWMFADFARNFFEKFFDFTGLGFVMEKISFKIQMRYLKNRFEKSGGYASEESDFFVTPQLIAYHFPVSNYHRELKNMWKSSTAPDQNSQIDPKKPR